MKLNLLSLFTIILACQSLSGQEVRNSTWVDSVMMHMSLDEKIGQLFMIRAHSDLPPDHIKSVEKQIEKYHVGGLCFFQGTPEKQAKLTKLYQKKSKLPLMIAMDAEWGLAMRHKASALSYPKQLTLGAISDNTLIYDMGKDIARQLRRIGSHINFAPVADVNNNPANPVIHNRSFGEDIYNVATKSYAYMKGLQDNGVMACAKHFPGHGDTDVDSHYDLPLIKHSKNRLDSLELMPFRVLTQLGVRSMMSAHLAIPSLDDRPNRPSSLSKGIVTDLLRDKMHFDGVVFTDGLEMKGVAKHFEPGVMEVEALKAGNDVLLLPIDIDKAFKSIKKAIEKAELTEAMIDQKLRRILKAKQFLQLHKESPFVENPDSIPGEIKDKKSLALIFKLYEKAMTLAKDDKNLVPVADEHIKSTAVIALGSSPNNFTQRLEKFGICNLSAAYKNQPTEIYDKVRSFDRIIISVHDMSIYRSKDNGIKKEYFDLIYKLNSHKNVILVLFGTPYALEYFSDIGCVLIAYEDNPLVQDVAAQSLVGVNRITGKLPVGVNENFQLGQGIDRAGLFRLGFAIPEAVGISSDSLLVIDTIVQEMLDKKATPGCQILAARNGKIFFQKAYGKHTPEGNTDVKLSDIYDVASVTKIMATTLSLMKLYDESKINLYEKLVHYISELDTSDKAELILEDILAHHAGLPGWIPFYERTLDTDSRKLKRLNKYYRETPSDSFDIEVCRGLYLRSDWRDSIYHLIYSCELREKKDYRYSDLGFYLFQKIIEKLSEKRLDQFAHDNFYGPMNLKNTMFNPSDKVDGKCIVPSEDDDYYRGRVLKGHVHDMGAAMMGGVAGHAGLFSNAQDLAILMQMLLNGGSYGGHNYLKPQTIERFTKRYYKSSRRGLGFDMKELDPDKTLNMAEEASSSTFGHLGFTGIAVFADPEEDLIYIMLSNRTYPTMKNYIFASENYRPRIQSVFYKAIMDSKT